MRILWIRFMWLRNQFKDMNMKDLHRFFCGTTISYFVHFFISEVPTITWWSFFSNSGHMIQKLVQSAKFKSTSNTLSMGQSLPNFVHCFFSVVIIMARWPILGYLAKMTNYQKNTIFCAFTLSSRQIVSKLVTMPLDMFTTKKHSAWLQDVIFLDFPSCDLEMASTVNISKCHSAGIIKLTDLKLHSIMLDRSLHDFRFLDF